VQGEVIGGRYRLDERIGAGAMSEVWAALDLELERPVAVKLLAAATDPDRFTREAQTVAALSHPHICRLFDFGESDGRPFIVFEYLPGGTLTERLRPGEPMADADAARVAAELAAALAHAHARGVLHRDVLHRDVKPSNVLFDEEDNAKLADFGIARLGDASTLTEAGTVMGTAGYISPEQAQAEPVTPATDVYAFGVVIYQLLTGRLPFEGEAALQVAARHVNEEPTPIAELRPDAPPALDRVATWSLAKRPEDRPADGAALVAALTQGAPAPVEHDTQVLRPRRPRRVQPRYFAMGAALAALALAGAAVAVLANPEPSKAPITPTKQQTTKRATTAPPPPPPPPPSESRPTTSERTTTTTPSPQPTVPPPPPATQPASPPPPPPPATTEPPPPTEPPPTTVDTTTVTTPTVP
jgi:eukaryotic-like serine/threonine-protein kinase